MPTILPWGVDYTQFLDDLRAVIRHEIQQAGIGSTLLSSGPATPLPDLEPLLSVKQAAYLLRVSTQTVHDWRRNGAIPFVKLGSRTYFKRTELLASLATQQRSAEGKSHG